MVPGVNRMMEGRVMWCRVSDIQRAGERIPSGAPGMQPELFFPDSDPGPERFFQRMIRARNRRFQSESIANHTSRTKKNFEENLFIQ